MVTEPHFLGWDAPPIDSLSNWILEAFAGDAILDLSQCLIALPSSAAVRQLQQQLVEHTLAHNLAYLPPEIITIGTLPESLYATKTAASESLQHLVWLDLLKKNSSAGKLKSFLPVPPQLTNNSAWVQIAESVARLHRELSGDGIRFNDVVKYLGNSGFQLEQARWVELSKLQEAYLRTLDQHDVWDLQTARIIAIQQAEVQLAPGKSLIVAGCCDLSKVQRQFLRAVNDQTKILVFAPHSMHECFDSVGCLLADRWNASSSTIDPSRVFISANPKHQALLVADYIATSPPNQSTAELLISTPDASDQLPIQRQLAEFDLDVSLPAGRQLIATGPGILIQLISNFIFEQSYNSLSAILRHPVVLRTLTPRLSPVSVIAELADYHESRLPFDTGNLDALPERWANLAEAWTELSRWLQPFITKDTIVAILHTEFLNVLNRVYGSRTLHRETDQELIAALSAINSAATEIKEAYELLGQLCTSTQYLSLIIDQISEAVTPGQHSITGISIAGWLDTPWTNHRQVMLLGVNEGTVPSSSNSDTFLPDGLRMSLGINNNQRRLARDAYALALLEHSRDLVVFTKRANQSGDPQIISRLLLHGTLEQQAELIHRFSTGGVNVANHKLDQLSSESSLPAIEVKLEPYMQESYSVTSLRAYLQCPVRYYLHYVLGLRSVQDDSVELSPLAFGLLVHDVLQQFGTSEYANSIDSVEIDTYLRDRALATYRRRYGKSSYPTIRLQLEQVFHRLSIFSRWQAEWRAEGWEIQHVEFDSQEPAIISSEAPDCKVHGRIDRIDFHQATNTYAVFDYKTSDRAATPKAAHQITKPPYWKDLQLPMYRHLTRDITSDSSVRLGYISLSNDGHGLNVNFAEWDEAILQQADRVAIETIRCIRSGNYGALSESIDSRIDDYADLLGLTALDSPLLQFHRSEAQ